MRTFIRVFKDKKALRTMLRLRRTGWTYQSLAFIFNVDHSSIYKVCKIRHVEKPLQPISLNVLSILSQVVAPYEEPKEKTYADYLKEIRQRRFPKLYGIIK